MKDKCTIIKAFESKWNTIFWNIKGMTLMQNNSEVNNLKSA